MAVRALVAALLLACPLAALDPDTAISQYVRTDWTVDQGLPQNSLYAIAQTRDGYLWFGTEEGVARFDGVKFTVFDDRNTPGLADKWITALHAGRNGDLWIGTTRGLTRWRQGVFQAYATDRNRSGLDISSLCEAADGTLWIGTAGGLKQLKDDGQIRTYTDGGLATEQILALLEDREGALWVATHRGVVRLRAGHVPDRVLVAAGASGAVTALALGNDGAVWMGTGSGKLARWLDGRLSMWSRNAGLPSETIETLMVDRANSIWIGYDGAGLARATGAGYSGRNSWPALRRQCGHDLDTRGPSLPRCGQLRSRARVLGDLAPANDCPRSRQRHRAGGARRQGSACRRHPR